MPVSPDDAEKLAREIRKLYALAETEMLEDLARRLARGIDAPDWVEKKLAELGAVRSSAAATASKLSRRGQAAISHAVTEAWKLGTTSIHADLVAAGAIAAGTPLPPINTAAVQALAADAAGLLTRATSSIVRTVPDAYQRIIVDASARILTGSTTRRVAAQSAINRFADAGITRFVDSAQRVWNLDSYAEMATRTSAGRAAVRGAEDRLRRSDITLVLISDSPEECPLCEPWEGEVVTTADDEGYPSLAQAEAEGLFHPNCTHSISAYIPGVTERGRATSNPEGNRQRVEQRRLERNVRKWKRREAAALDPASRAAARNKVREWNGRLSNHISEFDRKRIPGRTSI